VIFTVGQKNYPPTLLSFFLFLLIEQDQNSDSHAMSENLNTLLQEHAVQDLRKEALLGAITIQENNS